MKTLQQHDTIYTPYCYLIGWKKHNKFYYGCRYAKNYKCLYESGCHPDDFWGSYRGSSRYVDEMIERYGEPDIKEVRRAFTTAKDAQNWETTVINRLGAVASEQWLNKNAAGAIHWTEEMKRNAIQKRTGFRHTEKSKKKMSDARRGKTKQEITNNPNYVDPRKGKTAKDIYGEGYVSPRKGGPQTYDCRIPRTLFVNNIRVREFESHKAFCKWTGMSTAAATNLKNGQKLVISEIHGKGKVKIYNKNRFNIGDIVHCL